ncbi:MAG TPA: ATP-binding protein [Gemmatimonadaceae bacterium]|nr:ATP-binding protein [Gemmatimonadaceae bacterium]
MPDVATPRVGEVAILAPTGRDAPLAATVFARWGIAAKTYPDMASVCDLLAAENVGAMVMAEEALQPEPRERLLHALDAQPSWSDVPIIVLTAEGELSRALAGGVDAVARRGNVTLLERPVRVATLVTVVRSALRARQRQYDVRDSLAALHDARAEAEEARAEAEAANRAKSEFLAVMSHELRTPLNAIAGYAELIELGIHGPVTEAQREALRRVQRSERHLLGLINGVLNYARIETGSIAYEIIEVVVADALAAAEALVAPQAKARSLRLEVEPCDRSLLVRADLDKLQQILLNLLSNAIKFTGEGGRVSMFCEADERDVMVRVADTGRGIPESKRAAIFEPFVQVDARLTRPDEGVGLGLAISRDLARGMGGDLTVESEEGVGSTFTLCVPSASRDW